MISVVLDLPDDFKPKAAFAIKAMLSAFFIDASFADAAKGHPGSEQILLYYGLNPESEMAENADLVFTVSEDTLSFFSGFRTYPTGQIFHVDSENGQVPVLFGKDHISDDRIEADIIASAFFFLSDWQRMLPGKRDEHGRVLYNESVQYEMDAADRPLVNEYADFLVELIRHKTGQTIERRSWKGRDFGALITHDLDYIRKRYRGTLKRELFDIPLKNPLNKSISYRLKRAKGTIADLITTEDRYVESIRKMLDLEKKTGVRPTVMLKSSIKKHVSDARDYLDDPFVDEIIQKTDACGGEIGFHSSYMGGYDPQLFGQEMQQLEKRIKRPLISHRFHYIRFDHERGMNIPEKYGFKVDSSLGWAGRAGYRTAFLHPHPVWDIRNNRPLALMQVPLMLMDMQVLHYMQQNAEQGVETAMRQVDLARKYHGLVVWNYHHITYDPVEAEGCDVLFEKSLNYLMQMKPAYLTLGELNET